MSAIYILFLFYLVWVCARSLFKPAVAAAVLLCFFPLKQILQAEFRIFAETPLFNYLMAGVIALSVLVVFTRGRRYRKYPYPITQLAFIFISLLYLSMFWKAYNPIALSSLTRATPYIGLYCFVLPELICEEQLLGKMWHAFIWIAAIAGAVAFFFLPWEGRSIAFVSTGLSWSTGMGTLLYQGGNPLAIANMAMQMALILILLNDQRTNKALFVLRWGLVLLAVAIMLRSGTRGSVVALAASLFIFLPLSKKIKNFRGFLATVVLIAILAGIGYWTWLQVSQSSRWDSSLLQRDTNIRVHILNASLEAWARSPFRSLLGYGFDGSFTPELNIGFPEVGPAAILVDLGIVGVFLWAMMAGFAWKSWRRCYRIVAEDDVRRGYLCVLGAIVFAEWLNSLKGSGYLNFIGWFILVGRYELLLGAKMEAESEHSLHEEAPVPQLRLSHGMQ